MLFVVVAKAVKEKETFELLRKIQQLNFFKLIYTNCKLGISRKLLLLYNCMEQYTNLYNRKNTHKNYECLVNKKSSMVKYYDINRDLNYSKWFNLMIRF